jgi:hypothetical protein
MSWQRSEVGGQSGRATERQSDRDRCVGASAGRGYTILGTFSPGGGCSLGSNIGGNGKNISATGCQPPDTRTLACHLPPQYSCHTIFLPAVLQGPGPGSSSRGVQTPHPRTFVLLTNHESPDPTASPNSPAHKPSRLPAGIGSFPGLVEQPTVDGCILGAVDW